MLLCSFICLFINLEKIFREICPGLSSLYLVSLVHVNGTINQQENLFSVAYTSFEFSEFMLKSQVKYENFLL